MSQTVYNNPLFRPPSEAESLILQVDQGCPYNHCTFCGMYRGVKYLRRNPAEIRELIAAEARQIPEARRIFLADGDVMRRPFEELQFILTELAARFPELARVNVYATGSAIAAKTDEQLQALRVLKLHTLYLGLESGDEEVLRQVKKAETAAVMIEAGQRAQQAGLRLSVMMLLGLGGVERSHEHAAATAAALNQMQPRLLAALRVVPVPGTELYADEQAGRFRQVSEYGVVQELREIIARLELSNTVFRANHSSNVVPLEGRLPHDQTRLVAELDRLLLSRRLDDESPGRTPLWL
ncbi:MAG: radical SAM protein [Kiritimatiellaeota bacterium]|nr:radical SAM protein [Kiritimatiellota bacterium]